ncbi:MAG: alpha/beta fold hydrolase [Candidatus Lokiarchaeota archaeon]|nr:alpha/beta fold hydrolase [Candidatus Lokiarchaeota archaeon]
MASRKQSTVMDETGYMIIGELTHKDQKSLKNLLLFIILLIISLSILQFNKEISYNHYERVQFESSGARLYANLYYPSKTLDFQEKRPLVIYCHGIGSKRDFDLRIPVEFTKRGFYIAALDYQGHGESGGNINNIDPITGIPALAQDCSKLLDKLETLPFYSDVNLTQIGLIGHSLGGMVVLMNQALDSRFKVIVGLAPLVNFEPPRYGFAYNEDLIDYIPINLLNKENTENLLIIHHIDDEILDFNENALKAQELTNCSLITMKGFMIGGAHQLFSDRVLIKSINWFESHFFNSETLNGHINITFYWNYILIIVNLVLLFVTVIYLTSLSSKLFFKKEKGVEKSSSYDFETLTTDINKKRQILKVFLLIGVFLGNWVLFERFFGLPGVLYASLNMVGLYYLVKFLSYLKASKAERRRIFSLKYIKNHFKFKYLIFIMVSTVYLIAIYMMFSFYYPFSFIWPSNFAVHFILGYLAFPIFMSIELLFRKIIYPQLNFLKSKSSKNRVILITTILVLISLMFLTKRLSYFPSLLFTFIIFVLVIIQNTKIFENIKCFYPVVFISFTIIQIFFAAVISNAIGISLTIS